MAELEDLGEIGDPLSAVSPMSDQDLAPICAFEDGFPKSKYKIESVIQEMSEEVSLSPMSKGVMSPA